MNLDLTIAIPVKNEGENLPACLEAIGKNFAKKIVIIDSASVDNTREVAHQFGAELVTFNWNGRFPKKRNWFLREHTPTTKWVLFLDADELISDEFKNEVNSALTQGKEEGYWLNYSVYFMGKRLKGGYPLRKLALFQVGAGEYEHINENSWSELDMEIHEHPVLQGVVGNIKSKIDHRDMRGVGSYVRKHNEYADWEAKRYVELHNAQEYRVMMTWKQKFKYGLIKSVLIGPVYFVGSFIYYRGFLDGSTGFAFAIFKMSYFTQIYCRIKEIEDYQGIRN